MTDSIKVRIPVDEISIDVPCRYDLNDDRGSLFLMAGHAITESLRNSLIQNGSSYLEVDSRDAKALWGHTSDPTYKKDQPDPSGGSGSDFRSKDPSAQPEPYCPKRAKEFQAKLSVSIDQLSGFGARIDQLNNDDMETACAIPATLLSMLLDDGDQALSALELGGKDVLDGSDVVCSPNDPLATRCLQMSMLAMNTGIELGLDEQRIDLLGQAALLHDFGLFRLDSRLRDPAATLSDVEKQTYRRHPHLSQDLLKGFMVPSDATKIVVGQVHELPDGSGFPRGLGTNTVHPLAKIIGLVDSYLSLVEPGPGRGPLHPHDAIAVLLHEGSRGRFEAKTLKAFLMQITLFPIGSIVRLDDATQATVARRDGPHYANPWVRIDTGTELLSTRNGQRSIASPARDLVPSYAKFSSDQLKRMSIAELVAVA
jgi:HD-GYP domain-containing protein (c-di-GMP phosphodiesterase class II)